MAKERERVSKQRSVKSNRKRWQSFHIISYYISYYNAYNMILCLSLSLARARRGTEGGAKVRERERKGEIEERERERKRE